MIDLYTYWYSEQSRILSAKNAPNFVLLRCYHEHVDIFSEMENLDKKTLIETPFGGRFCGQNIPRNINNSFIEEFISL